MIKIVRPSIKNTNYIDTENLIDDIICDYEIINDGTLDEFRKKGICIIKDLEIIVNNAE